MTHELETMKQTLVRVNVNKIEAFNRLAKITSVQLKENGLSRGEQRFRLINKYINIMDGVLAVGADLLDYIEYNELVVFRYTLSEAEDGAV